MAYSLHYAERVRKVLLAAGLEGTSQNRLHQRSRTPKYDIKDLLMLLDAWQKREWVDKFTDPHNRKVVYWRATQKLADDWPIITNVIDELVLGELPSTGQGS